MQSPQVKRKMCQSLRRGNYNILFFSKPTKGKIYVHFYHVALLYVLWLLYNENDRHPV